MTPPEPSDRHETVQALLPWYANGSLETTEHARVTAHLEVCARCRQALEEERRIAAVVRASALPARSPEPALAQLMTTIAARNPATPARVVRPPAPPFWKRWFAAWPPASPWPMALAGAGALAIVATVGTIAFQPQAPDAYHVLGLAPASRTVADDIHLVMAPSVDVARRDAILAIVDGRIVEGPNSVGAYTVRISASGGPVDLTGALDRLRREPDVLLAEAATPLAMPHIGEDLPQ